MENNHIYAFVILTRSMSRCSKERSYRQQNDQKPESESTGLTSIPTSNINYSYQRAHSAVTNYRGSECRSMVFFTRSSSIHDERS